MNTRVYYFSGTGNSLYVARRIQEKLGETELIKITAALLKNPPTVVADGVGIVFPVYAWGPPGLVVQFLKRVTIKQPQYLFMVATNGGGPENALFSTQNLLHKKGLTVHAAFDLTMPGNFITGGNPPSVTEARALLQAQEPELAKICDMIAARQAHPATGVASISGKLKTSFVHPLFLLGASKQGKKFSATTACTGCGICANVCPVNNITLNSAKQPVWGAQCEFCLACIHWCPAQAIESGNATQGRNRYHHPDVTSKELMAQPA